MALTSRSLAEKWMALQGEMFEKNAAKGVFSKTISVETFRKEWAVHVQMVADEMEKMTKLMNESQQSSTNLQNALNVNTKPVDKKPFQSSIDSTPAKQGINVFIEGVKEKAKQTQIAAAASV